MFSGCAGVYSDSALALVKENTNRVESGYSAKKEMTAYIIAYLEKQNHDCGVKVTVENGVPVTNVKECIRIDDALAAVDKVEIVRPQNVGDMLQSAGDFLVKATNIAVPIASFYYGSKNQIAQTEASVKINESNNAKDSSMINTYTTNFDKTTNIDTSTTLTDTSTVNNDKDYSVTTTTTDKDYSNTTTANVPTFTFDGTKTTLGD